VARRGDHIERADPIAGVHGSGGLGRGARVATAELVLRLVRIEAHVLGQEPGVACRDDHLCLGKPLLQGVERADVVAVCVREEDADRARKEEDSEWRQLSLDSLSRGARRGQRRDAGPRAKGQRPPGNVRAPRALGAIENGEPRRPWENPKAITRDAATP
jgi:hypothetical protein